MMNTYEIKPNSKIKLGEWDSKEPRSHNGGEEEGKARLLQLNLDFEKLQELFYAERKHKLLIILQGMDTSGKDGVIRNVFEGVNPQGVRVASFKAPSPEELDHDYLWRIHKQTPGKGEIVIFNRSHYEDVLVVRVHNLVPPETWKNRFEQINHFEKTLSEEGTIILKFFLHISRDEQKERLMERLDNPEKRWKFNPNDLKERKLWDAYQKAYEDVLEKTSTDWAPWYLIPSDRNWSRNLAIASILVKKVKELDMQYPVLEGSIEEYKTALDQA